MLRTLVGLAALVAAVPASAQVTGGAVVLDALAATVGSRVIRLSDVRLARDLGLFPGDSSDVLLERLVDHTLMLAELERFQQPHPPVTQVDLALDAIRDRVGLEQWRAALVRSGTDEDYVRAIVRDGLRLDAYLRQRFGPLAETSVAETATPGVGASADERGRRFDELVAEWIAELRGRGEVWRRALPRDADS